MGILDVLKILFLFILRISVALIGIVILPFLIPFARHIEGTDLENGWYLKKLPTLFGKEVFWIFDNDRDGMLGDTQRRWADRDSWRKGDIESFINNYWWLAIRNPVNNLRFTSMFGCPVMETEIVEYEGDDVVKDKPGMGGKYVVRAKAKQGFNLFWKEYPGMYYVKEYKSGTRALVVQIGFKISKQNYLEDFTGDETRQWKGFTLEINPYKEI